MNNKRDFIKSTFLAMIPAGFATSLAAQSGTTNPQNTVLAILAASVEKLKRLASKDSPGLVPAGAYDGTTQSWTFGEPLKHGEHRFFGSTRFVPSGNGISAPGLYSALPLKGTYFQFEGGDYDIRGMIPPKGALLESIGTFMIIHARDGQVVIRHESATAAATTTRVICKTGADVVIARGHCATLVYTEYAGGRWYLMY